MNFARARRRRGGHGAWVCVSLSLSHDSSGGPTRPDDRATRPGLDRSIGRSRRSIDRSVGRSVVHAVHHIYIYNHQYTLSIYTPSSQPSTPHPSTLHRSSRAFRVTSFHSSSRRRRRRISSSLDRRRSTTRGTTTTTISILLVVARVGRAIER